MRAVEVLMAPLEWGSRDAWLAESLRRVRAACRAVGPEPPGDAVGELEALLRLPGDEPGWLHAAFASVDADRRDAGALPAITEGSEVFVLVVSLRCALLAGLATLHRLGAWRSTLGEAFDDVETGMAIFGADGLAEVARNGRLDELLEEEPARDRLRDLIAGQARRAAVTESLRQDVREVEVGGGIYRLVASRAAAGTLLAEAAVLVLVDRLSPGLPTTQELRVSFGLRGREPQIALLAAEGLSNVAIAQRLRLSAHTVRHYLERVLDRLGLHTRKALALRLMAGGGERQEPPNRVSQ